MEERFAGFAVAWSARSDLIIEFNGSRQCHAHKSRENLFSSNKKSSRDVVRQLRTKAIIYFLAFMMTPPVDLPLSRLVRYLFNVAHVHLICS